MICVIWKRNSTTIQQLRQASEGNVVLIEAADRRAEIHAVARTIRKLMTEGKRYKDIAILYRQPEKYDELIEYDFPAI